MAFDSQTHAAIHRTSKANRAAGKRARRAVQLVQALDHDGAIVLVALSQTRDGFAYVVKADGTGRLACSCPGFVWRRRCSHVAAASREGQPQPMAGPNAAEQRRVA